MVWMFVEVRLSHVNNKYSYKYNYAKNNPAVKTLLIGHSHFENSVNPYLMGDSVFDFALSGSSWIFWDAKLAEQLYPTMPNLKTVIFPLGYIMPYQSPHYQDHSGYEELLYMHSKYMNTPYDLFPQNIKYRSALLCNKIKNMQLWRDEYVDSLGYRKLDGKSLYFQEGLDLLRKYSLDNETDMLCYEEYRRYFIQLAKVCNQNNIRFVVVTCPCADCYVEATCERGLKNLYDLVDSVAAHYPIEYFNYLNDAEFREDSLYYNCSHLNKIGADKFAKRLKQDLRL